MQVVRVVKQRHGKGQLRPGEQGGRWLGEGLGLHGEECPRRWLCGEEEGLHCGGDGAAVLRRATAGRRTEGAVVGRGAEHNGRGPAMGGRRCGLHIGAPSSLL
jgi:hypothetical protein